MSINLLPADYQKEFKRERVRRLIALSGFTIFLIILANIILLSPLWVLFNFQAREHLRQLSVLKQSSAFLRATGLEAEIKKLNADVARFNNEEKNIFEVAPIIKAILGHRPSGVSISGISFTAGIKEKGQPSSISLSGLAQSRDLLLRFAESHESDKSFSKISSPITNLLKETDIDYSLTLDLR